MLFVGTYVSCRLFVNVRHSMSSACGSVVLCSFCRPIRAISLLKSSQRMCVWFECLVICCVIVCWINGMDRMSSSCDGMYMCIINQCAVVGFLFLLFVGMVRFLLG